MGGDPNQAARNIDEQQLQAPQDEQFKAPFTPPPAPAPVLRNLPKFDDYTQGLAGTLIAEKTKLDRVREDLTDQMLAAQRARDDELAAAKAAYDERVRAAGDAFTETNALLEAKANNAVQAQEGIKRALDALT